MKINLSRSLLASGLAGVLVLSSCGDSPENGGASPGAQSSQPPAPAPAEESDSNLPEKTVEITGNDQMKFDVTEIEAQPRQKVTVTLKNIGTMPKISMGHNWVLLVKDADPDKFLQASMTDMANDFIAPAELDKVIAHTKLLGPGESDTISFTAPQEPGDYVYLCSFPGHYAIGMKGILTVQ